MIVIIIIASLKVADMYVRSVAIAYSYRAAVKLVCKQILDSNKPLKGKCNI